MKQDINITANEMKKFLSIAFNLGLKGSGDLESDCIDSIFNEIEKIKEGFGRYTLEELKSLKKGTLIIHKTLGRGKIAKSSKGSSVIFDNGQQIHFGTPDHPWDKEMKIIQENN